MTINIWAQVGTTTYTLPMETLLGTSNQLLGMNDGATALQYKNATFKNSTNQFELPAGTVAAPSYTFQGSLGTGFYLISTDTLGIAIAGTQIGSINSSRFLLSNVLQMSGKIIEEDFGADIPAANGTTDLAGATGNFLTITNSSGAKVITSFGADTLPAGTEIETLFTITGGSVSITHNATSLILLGGSDINLQTGDVCRWRKINDSSPYWRQVSFQRGISASGLTNKGDVLLGAGAGATLVLAVGSNGQIIFADSTESTGWRWGNPTSVTPQVRQSVQSGPVDANGYANFLSAGTGLNFNIDASPTPVNLSYASGFSAGVPVDLNTSLIADLTDQGILTALNTNFLHATYLSSSGITPGSCLIPPQYGYAFDRTQGALLNFEGSDGSTTMLDDFGNTWTASGNAQLDTAQSKFGSSSLLLDGTGDYIESTNFTSLGGDSWEMSCWFRINSLPGSGAYGMLMYAKNSTTTSWGAQIGLKNTTGTTRMTLFLSSNGTSWDLLNDSGGSNTTWTLNQWNKVRLVFDALAGTYRVYLSLNGAAETQDQTLSSSSRICGLTSIRLGVDGAGSNGFNGWIDAFRFIRAATVTGTETPSASAPSITDYPVHFFSIPEMKMYEVTAASASAGTNPTLTARNRLFLGEADTGISTITAIRNYAIRGQYETMFACPGTNTRTSKSHNIGIVPKKAVAVAINISPENGYIPGDEVPIKGIRNSTGNVEGNPIDLSRNAMGFMIDSVQLSIPSKSSPGTLFTITQAKWNVRLQAERGW